MDGHGVGQGRIASIDTGRSGLAARHDHDQPSGGAMQLFTRLVDDALARHLAGAVSSIEVEVDDEHVCVRHDGSPNEQVPKLALLGQRARRVELESSRFGARRRWLFAERELLVEGERVEGGDDRGTSIRVWPSAWTLAHGGFDLLAVEQRLLGIHRLRPSLRVMLNGQRFDEPRGTEAWLAGQRCCRGLQVHHIEARRGTTELDLAWAWLPPFGSARRSSYVNFVETVDDGAHVDGLLEGLARAHGVALALAREQCLAIVSVVAINPRFSAAGRGRLQDPALERWIAGLVEQHLQ